MTLKSKAYIVGKARIKITVKHVENIKGTSNSIKKHPNEQKWLGVRVYWSQEILLECSEGNTSKKTYVKTTEALF